LGRLKPQPFREVKRRLEAADFVESSQKGSHVKFIRRLREVVDVVIVPRKREIPMGTLRSILNQAHIDLDEWEKLGE
jgi:predicted RNA binding protein YcfA (HicA-like mRNA interferase family)